MLQNLIYKYQLLQLSAQQELMNFLENLLEKQQKNVQNQKIEPTQMTTIIEEYRGIGKGIWNIDGQEYINQLRDSDRI